MEGLNKNQAQFWIIDGNYTVCVIFWEEKDSYLNDSGCLSAGVL